MWIDECLPDGFIMLPSMGESELFPNSSVDGLIFIPLIFIPHCRWPLHPPHLHPAYLYPPLQTAYPSSPSADSLIYIPLISVSFCRQLYLHPAHLHPPLWTAFSSSLSDLVALVNRAFGGLECILSDLVKARYWVVYCNKVIREKLTLYPTASPLTFSNSPPHPPKKKTLLKRHVYFLIWNISCMSGIVHWYFIIRQMIFIWVVWLLGD